MAMKQIAVFGGTFDPVHNGHLKLAENACSQFRFDGFWFMPAPNPPHKTDRTVTDYRDRMEMVRLAIASYPEFSCSDFEAGLSGKSYTSETILALKEKFPDTEFSLIMGADSFFEIEKWHDPETVLKNSSLVVADRDYGKTGISLNTQKTHLQTVYGTKISFIRADEVDISSEHLREMLSNGRRGTEKYLPPAVLSYILSHHLYSRTERKI